MSKNGNNLQEYIKNELSDYPNLYRLTQDKGWPHGLVDYVMKDDSRDSPTLRRIIGLPKHPKRDRLIINGCPPELKARFTALRNEHGMTRLEMFAELVTFYEME